MFTIETYFSLQFLLFLTATILLYEILPQRGRRLILLLSSYVFFYSISRKLVLYLIMSTFSIHHFGLWLADSQNECKTALAGIDKKDRDKKKEINALYLKKQRRIMAFAVLLHIGVLLVLKYSGFAITNLNSFFHLVKAPLHIRMRRFWVPIGISFYTLQAVSYLFDVYRQKISADRSLLRLAMFMSFFPQIMEGPICRYSDTSEELWNAKRIEYSNFIAGLQRILYGLMKKIVVVDRIDPLVKEVFANYGAYDGLLIAVAAIFYTIELYCDFSGTMDLVIGTAQILLPLDLRVLEKMARHAGYIFQRLRFLPTLDVQAPQEADIQSAEKTRKSLRSAARRCDRALYCVALQRTLARRRMELHLLRYVPLHADPYGKCI